MMKLTVALLSLLAGSAVNGQMSQPECGDYTDEVYAANPAIEPAEEAYIDTVGGSLGADCLNSDGTLKNCDTNFGQSNVGDTYTAECQAGNGTLWLYDFSPLCDNSTSFDQRIGNILVCASKRCTDKGVANLIPNPGLLFLFEEANHTCGTSVPSDSIRPSSASTVMVALSAVLCVGSALAFM